MPEPQTQDVLEDLRAAQARVAELDEQREVAMRERDEVLRRAQAAGRTYVDMQAASGLTPATIAKALRRS